VISPRTTTTTAATMNVSGRSAQIGPKNQEIGRKSQARRKSLGEKNPCFERLHSRDLQQELTWWVSI
jgi:hypothetical protein